MKLNDTCCNTETLETVKELYTSNADEFVLLHCPACNTHWFYRKLERNWQENIRFGWNNYEAWYVKIVESDLRTVLA